MYKKGLIDTLLYRAYSICSNYSGFHQKISYLKTVWEKNSLPLFFIDKCIQKFLNKLFIKRNHQTLTSTKKEVLITVNLLVINIIKYKTRRFNCKRQKLFKVSFNNPFTWKSKTQVTGYEFKLRVTSSNPRATSSNPRVTSANSRDTSSNSRATSSNLRVRTLKTRVAKLKARFERLKARVGRLKARVRRLKPRVR